MLKAFLKVPVFPFAKCDVIEQNAAVIAAPLFIAEGYLENVAWGKFVNYSGRGEEKLSKSDSSS